MDRPSDVTRAAGDWLASQLAPDGFLWARSRAKLERRDGRRREQIFLQSSTWNRAGEQIAFGLVLNVRDGDLMRWRHDNRSRTLRAAGEDDWVCGHPLMTLTGRMKDSQVDLTQSESRSANLEECLRVIQWVVLPWFATTSDPATLVFAVPDVTLDLYASELAEFMVSRDEREGAAMLIRRWLALDSGRRREKFEVGCGFAESGRLPTEVRQNNWVAVGWSTAALGLAEALP